MEFSLIAKKLFQEHQEFSGKNPRKELIESFAENVLSLIFPHFSTENFSNPKDLEQELHNCLRQLAELLHSTCSMLPDSPENLKEKFSSDLPIIKTELAKDAQAIYEGDPAARSIDEVIICYPGFYAIAIYRIAHCLFHLQIPLLPRVLTEFAHSKTGIDIHPGATIGNSFCIDHGTGIVIGETTLIGDNVKIYQGVTIGALSVQKTMANTKRHPTIEDNVVVYSGATILGGDTVIGEGSTIGGNVWITSSVPAKSTVYYKNPAKLDTEAIE